MNFLNKILILLFIFLFSACVNNTNTRSKHKPDKIFYSSSGFALLYDESYYDEKIIKSKLDNNTISIFHSFLKKNTSIKIINPENSKFVETKVTKKIDYPAIFNVVISKKIAQILEIDPENPFVEVIELKKNKTFVAKESNTFDEERNVAETAPVDEVKMDDLSKQSTNTENNIIKKNNFVLVVSDFYYLESAENLKNELIEKTRINNFSIRKLGSNKYRLSLGPFKNFNALKTSYISLNNLGFKELNIYRE